MKPPQGNCEPPETPGGTWRPVPDHGLGISATGFTYAWTGEELLIWGEPTEVDEEGRPIMAAAYSPEQGTWRDVSAHGVLEGGRFATSVWTGSEWIVWGGESTAEPEKGKKYRVVSGGARFSPEDGTWTPIAESPLGGRIGAASVWTGKEMIVWGGYSEDGDLTADQPFGAAYDPEADSWRAINPSGAPRAHLSPVWTGEHAVFWAALGDVTYGAKYDPERDVWSQLSTTGGPVPSGAALWTGKEVLAFAFAAYTFALVDAAAYDPLVDHWRTLSTTGAPPFTRQVWAGDRVLAWGDPGSCPLIGSYDPTRDEWTRLGGAGAPTPRSGPALVWTGTSLLVFGGWTRSGDEVEEHSDGGEFVLGAD